MNISAENFQKEIYQYIDEVKELLSPDIWENILLNCTKNEMLILFLLYRSEEVNMTQVAEYIHVPLNTATGIVARMEKRNLLIRVRSIEDKRIVTIKLCDDGLQQIQSLIKEITYYGTQITNSFTTEEMALFFRMLQKTLQILKQERTREENKSKVKKIVIE